MWEQLSVSCQVTIDVICMKIWLKKKKRKKWGCGVEILTVPLHIHDAPTQVSALYLLWAVWAGLQLIGSSLILSSMCLLNFNLHYFYCVGVMLHDGKRQCYFKLGVYLFYLLICGAALWPNRVLHLKLKKLHKTQDFSPVSLMAAFLFQV